MESRIKNVNLMQFLYVANGSYFLCNFRLLMTYFFFFFFRNEKMI
jgi:hypothetical protein